jgi:diguanylate cyclase (GGDEF)-like protein
MTNRVSLNARLSVAQIRALITNAMNKFSRALVFILLYCLGITHGAEALAQTTSLHGAPLMQHYTAKDYNASPQHNTIATDKTGRLYVGNTEGILLFDGTAWELIELPEKQTVHSLVRGEDNKMYVASFDTFGELLTGKDGKQYFQELLSFSGLQGKARHIGIVWTAFATGTGIYFQAEHSLFFISYDRKTHREWPLSENVRSIFAQQETIYARINGVGLSKLVNGKFQLEPGGDMFANQALPGAINKGSWRLLVSDQGFYRADDKGIKRLSNNAGAELDNSDAYEVLVLADNSFVVGTRRGELLRFSENLILLERLKLGSYAITAMNADNEGGLWVATEGDLVRLTMPSPWSYLDASQGVQGIAYDFEWHEGALWTANSSGIARITPLANGTTQYQEMPWIHYEAFALNSSDAGLLVGHREGLLVLEKSSDTPRVLIHDLAATVTQLEESRFDKNIIYALSNHDVFILSKALGQWQIKKRYPLGDAGVDSLLEIKPGEIWLSDNYSGPQRWRLDTVSYEVKNKKTFLQNDGLPLNVNQSQHVYQLDGNVHVVTGSKAYVLNGDKFVVDRSPPFTLLTRPHELAVAETPLGAYAYSTREMWFRPKDQKQWQALQVGLGSAAGYGTVRLNQDGVVRMSTWGGILQYNNKEKSTLPEPLSLNFDYVTAVNPDTKTSISLPKESRLQLVQVPPGNNLKLRFSMVSLENGVEFRYRMLQLSSEWGPWSDRDLFIRAQPPGDYVLEVQARTLAGREAEKISYRYTMLPYWYEILWVRFLIFLACIAALCLLTYWFIRHRIAKYRDDNLKLEKRISERTTELELLNQQLSELVTEDSLTGVSNRRALEHGLQREWYRCLDQRRPLSALMIDVDHFKRFNDKHGHLEGDVLLREIAQTLKKEHDPKRELLARFGGEEFALLLPGVNLEEAVRRADQIRQNMALHNKNVTVSIGAAGFVPSIQLEQSSLLRRADAALYRAKRAGRNRVESDND